MTPEDSIYRFRLRALSLAEELGSVRAARKALGIHHSILPLEAAGGAIRPGAAATARAAPAADGQRDQSRGRAARGQHSQKRSKGSPSNHGY